MDAIIIGAGVVGCSIALELARAGYETVNVDAGPSAGSGSTSSSSACIRFHYSTWDAVLVSWEAHELWTRWDQHLGIVDDAGMARFVRTGALVLDTPGSNRETVLGLFDRAGLPYETWDAATIRRRVPALDPVSHFPPKPVEDEAFWRDPGMELGGYYTPDGGFIDDPQLAAHNLMVAARAAGATFRFRTKVVGVLRSEGRAVGVQLDGGEQISAPVVVNAAGPHSSVVNEMAGVLDDMRITTRALRQEVHVVPGPADFSVATGGVYVTDGDLGTYFRPQLGGTVLVGGLEPECEPLVWVDDPDDYVSTPTVPTWEAQTLRLNRRLPELGIPNRPVGLAALYDVTPDWVPIYDKSSLAGFFMACGTSGNQFKNAPMIGRMMAALIRTADEGRDHDVDPVTIDCARSGHHIDVGAFSRRREVNVTSRSVMA